MVLVRKRGWIGGLDGDDSSFARSGGIFHADQHIHGGFRDASVSSVVAHKTPGAVGIACRAPGYPVLLGWHSFS